MDIKIGVQHVQREIVIESDETSEAIKSKVAEALANGSILELTDAKGNTTLIPAQQLGYVEIGAESKRRIGFGLGEA